MGMIGMTTTIPAELVYAAGDIPLDLNNIFITADDRDRYIRLAEREGYPRNVCQWIKGLYGVLCERTDIDTVIAVTQGDCSNTHALMETLQIRGVRTIPFAYPYSRDRNELYREMARLADELGTDLSAAERECARLEPLRRKLDILDAMTWRDNLVSGRENHLWLVTSSDFNGDPELYSREIDAFLTDAGERPPYNDQIRLGFMGVPPILDDLYDVVEEYGARVVFNETQRQFSMPDRTGDIVDQYRSYTYPYDIFHRLKSIQTEIDRRNLHGVIHYVQSFCHRHIEDLVVRKQLPVPVLTVEGDAPGVVDERTKIRLQAFVEMLQVRIHQGSVPKKG